MKIIIVRHGQTDENVGDKLVAAKSDILLNEEGVLQAKKLGHHLRDHKITHAYSSPSKRAVHTAQEILVHHADVVTLHEEHLREQDKKGGETRQQVQNRAKSFFHSLIQKHLYPEQGRRANDTVLVVSHGGTLGVLLLDILEKELTEENYRAHQPKNTEFTIIEFMSDGKKQIHALNSRAHLD